MRRIRVKNVIVDNVTEYIMEDFIMIKEWIKEERGETNIIAIILIILVVIVLAAIFKQQLISIVNGLFDQLRDALGL